MPTLNVDDGGGLAFIAILFVAATFVVHFMFALAVFFDAQRQRRSPLATCWFVPPAIWGLATLLGGVFVAVAYWVMHHSTFARPTEVQALDSGLL